MLGTMLLMAASAVVEITPSLDTLTLATLNTGACSGGHVSVSASVRLAWTATNFNAATQVYKIYRDDLLVTSQPSSPYDYILAGLKEDDPHSEQEVNFNYRVDIVRIADNQVLATRSVSVTKGYGNCDTSEPV